MTSTNSSRVNDLTHDINDILMCQLIQYWSHFQIFVVWKVLYKIVENHKKKVLDPLLIYFGPA